MHESLLYHPRIGAFRSQRINLNLVLTLTVNFLSLQVNKQSQNSQQCKNFGSSKWPQSEALMLEALPIMVGMHAGLEQDASVSIPGPRID